MQYARPRRRRGGGDSGGQSLDSLLDTMTNVVGILVIVLVVTLLGVKDAVKRIDASLPEVSQEELDAQAADAAETAALLDQVKNKKDAGPKDPPPDIDALKKKIAALKEATSNPLNKELEALLKQLADMKKESKSIQDELEKLQKEYQELGTKLRNTPNRSGAVAPSIVQLPNPRPAPPKARAIYVLVKEGRIAVVDIDEMRETIHDRIVKAPAAVGAGKLTKAQRDGDEKIEADRNKLKTFISQLGLGRPHLKVDYRYTHENRWHHLIIQFAERGGESLKQINLPSSAYQGRLRSLKGKPVYFRFLVDRKSFELYLKARQMAERAGIPAGWQLHDSPEWATHNHPRIRVIGELPPPPPKPVDPNAPKPKPRPPQNLLD